VVAKLAVVVATTLAAMRSISIFEKGAFTPALLLLIISACGEQPSERRGQSSATRQSMSTGEVRLAQQVAELVNVERSKVQLPPLTWHRDAAQAAFDHSLSMAEENYFSHSGSDGSDVVERLGRVGVNGYLSCGENIAYGQTTPQEVMAGWMLSTGHRKNILTRDFTHIGVGICLRDPPYWTQVFLTLPSTD